MATRMIRAVYDGKVFRPIEPIELAPDTRVSITYEIVEMTQVEPYSFLDVALAANLDGPEDGSENHDKYLYGGKASNEK
ncbi:MAG: antitoxin family protein [Anaerolineae bacterium]|nr:antitoxin family protein [Anaerolineae bacterium]